MRLMTRDQILQRDTLLEDLRDLGFSAREIAALSAQAVVNRAGTLIIRWHFQGTTPRGQVRRETRELLLDPATARRLQAWMEQRRLWGQAAPLFLSCRGGRLKPRTVRHILERRRLARQRGER